MPRKKKKSKKEQPQLTPTGRKKKVLEPTLIRARNLRSSLLKRSKDNEDLKATTPSIEALHKFLSRDNYICYYTLETLTLDTLEVDHKTPLNRGGTNSTDNLCFASSSANKAKGILTAEEFRELLELIKGWNEIGRESLLRRLKQGHFG
jgi:5-methylcytosine-specific restriction endonuclease McrA